MKRRNDIVRRRMVNALVSVLLIFLLYGAVTGNVTEREKESDHSFGTLLLRELSGVLKESLYDMFVPCISIAGESGYETYWILREQIDSVFPLYAYIAGEARDGKTGGNVMFREILLAEAEEGINSGMKDNALPEKENEQEQMGETSTELLREEEAAMVKWEERALFIPHQEAQATVDLRLLQDYETLLTQFYTVDSNTMIGSDQLNVKSFLEKDMRISEESEGPQILIFHTHSQEGFSDSTPGDSSTSIVGVGERLTGILTDTYGYEVLHHRVAYDAETRDNAYSRALPGIEQVLRENPSIQVVIDLHRDEMPEGTKLVMDLDGRPTARFMFFNGLSRTKKTGNIAYLYNENLEDNLAFSFQLQLKAAEYYPGLTRKIYLKGYRYNMHLRDKYLLIELGAQNNTVEEAMNACDPLAHILDMVLSGGE